MADKTLIRIASDQTSAPTRAYETETGIYAEAMVPVARDGNAAEFSCAVVGAHAHVAAATLAAVQTYTKPAGATAMLAQNTGTAGLRFTLDGQDATASLGFQLPVSQQPILIPCPGTAIKMIREADGAALDYQWVK